MLNEISEQNNRRQAGGTGFADSIFRTSASSRDYAEGLFKRTVKKIRSDVCFEIFTTKKFFIISADGKPLVIKDFGYVEEKRCQGVFAFEEWLEKVLTA